MSWYVIYVTDNNNHRHTIDDVQKPTAQKSNAPISLIAGGARDIGWSAKWLPAFHYAIMHEMLLFRAWWVLAGVRCYWTWNSSAGMCAAMRFSTCVVCLRSLEWDWAFYGISWHLLIYRCAAHTPVAEFDVLFYCVYIYAFYQFEKSYHNKHINVWDLYMALGIMPSHHNGTHRMCTQYLV